MRFPNDSISRREFQMFFPVQSCVQSLWSSANFRLSWGLICCPDIVIICAILSNYPVLVFWCSFDVVFPIWFVIVQFSLHQNKLVRHWAHTMLRIEKRGLLLPLLSLVDSVNIDMKTITTNNDNNKITKLWYDSNFTQSSTLLSFWFKLKITMLPTGL